MKSSVIVGHFGTYANALEKVDARHLKSRQFSIQRSNEYRMHPWVLIYYGNFV